MLDVPFHTLLVKDLIQIFGLCPDNLVSGLTSDQVCKQRDEFGSNKFSEKKKENLFISFLKKYCQPFNLLLLVAAFLSFVLYVLDPSELSNIVLCIGIFVVSVMNTMLEFYQEYKTNELLKGFSRLVPPACTVVRDGVECLVDCGSLVVGDLVHLKVGDKVPADIRLLTATKLTVDNSSLTGESIPVEKRPNFDEFYEKIYTDVSKFALQHNQGGEKEQKNQTLSKKIIYHSHSNTTPKINMNSCDDKHIIWGNSHKGKINGFAEWVIDKSPSVKKQTSDPQHLRSKCLEPDNEFSKTKLPMELEPNIHSIFKSPLNSQNIIQQLKKTVSSDGQENFQYPTPCSADLSLATCDPISQEASATDLTCDSSRKTMNDGLSKANFESQKNTIHDDEDRSIESKTALEKDVITKENSSRSTTKSVEYERSENMVFSGDLVTSGKCLGIVVSVGDRTILGSIAALTVRTEETVNELSREIEEYVRKLGAIALFVSCCFYIIALLNGFTLKQNLFFCVGIFVAFVPQGLPATVTILLAIAAKQMSLLNVLVKDLRAVETLGSVSVLATDKTGTLTVGDMSVCSIWDGVSVSNVSCVQERNKVSGEAAKNSKNIDSACSERKSHSDNHENVDEKFSACKNAIINDFLFETPQKIKQTYDRKENQKKKTDDMQKIANKDIKIPEKNIIFENSKSEKLHETIGLDDIVMQESQHVKSPVLRIANACSSITSSSISVDPTEKALHKFAMKYSTNSDRLIFEDPFDSLSKLHIAVVASQHVYKVVVKGAPDRLLPFCSKFLGGTVDENFTKAFDDAYELLASCGQRVIAVCERIITVSEIEKLKSGKGANVCKNEKHYERLKTKSKDRVLSLSQQHTAPGLEKIEIQNPDDFDIQKDQVKGNESITVSNARESDIKNILESIEAKSLCKEMNFLGLVGIVDPPKKGVREAVLQLRLAGIRVVMVTGDHPLTATAIARQTLLASGITRFEAATSQNKHESTLTARDYDIEVVSGAEIDTLLPSDWENLLTRQQVIFARTSPTQKMRIVEAYQRLGHVVGVCGDGVNDAPALRQANLGISMHGTSSDCTRDAAHLVLLKDSFDAILTGVYLGRRVFCNLRRAVRYLLSHISPQVLPFVLFVGAGIPPPMSAVLLVLVDLCTELLPSIALTFEPADRDLMVLPPRKVSRNRDLVDVIDKNIISIEDFDKSIAYKNLNSSKKAKQITERSLEENDIEDAENLNYSMDQSTQSVDNYSNRAEKTKSAHITREENINEPKKITNRKNISSEGLCDADTLSWAYLEAGVITTAGALASYAKTFTNAGIPIKNLFMSTKTYFQFTSPPLIIDGIILNSVDQIYILKKAQSAYFIGILIGQAFNIFLCKSRNRYQNKLPIIGTIMSLLFGMAVVYTSVGNRWLMAAPVDLNALVFPLIGGIFMIIWFLVRERWRQRVGVDVRNLLGVRRARKRCIEVKSI